MAKLKDFLDNFDFKRPNWTGLPNGFPNCDLSELTSGEIGKFTSIRSLWELSQPEKPKARSRVWQLPQGYKFLVSWSNAVLLRILIRKVTEVLPKSEYRSKAQADDAARSVVANIEEGWKRPTTGEYLKFIGFSQGSLEEIRGDGERWLQDSFIKSIPRTSLKDLGIDLGKWNRWLKNPLNSSRVLYFPLDENRGRYGNLKEIKGKEITYEVLIELINKTDWNLRQLVESLERKLAGEKKYYQVEQARIKSKLK